MQFNHVFWIGIIVFLLFYIRFVLESTNEIDAKESMTSMREDDRRIDKIRQRMADAERMHERRESWKTAGASAALVSQQWSPTLYIQTLLRRFV